MRLSKEELELILIALGTLIVVGLLLAFAVNMVVEALV